jgi:signal transduction histidine kinase
LTSTALQNGQAGDTQGSGDSTVQRYAVKVQASDGTTVGVMQVGIQVGTQTTTLNALLEAMLILGIITVVVAALGGLFLANRALLPVRLAYARQRHFIADASHELRTPLTIVRADAEVLLRDRDRFSPDDVAILEDVVSETGHMANLANNMLNLARLEAGGMHMEQDVVDLSSIGREIARRMGPLAAEQDITLHFEDGEPVLVVGDKVQLDQVAVALVDNAIKYNHPGGEVVLRTWAEEQRAHLEVRDTGIGIAAEHLPRLGERFYRVDKARSREIGGAGLGISIVRTIAARHGGSLRYTSKPGKGTTATLTFPAAERGVKGVARAMP